MMEAADEMMMTAVELRSWIRDRVEKMPLISPAVLENCHILQSLLERRERQAACLLKLCKSLAACEEIVRKQYALLGWEYRDRYSDDDDDDDDITGCAETSGPSQSVLSASKAFGIECGDSCDSRVLLKKAVVVLHRLPAHQISALLPATAPQLPGEDESLPGSDCEMQWEPQNESDDSDDWRPKRQKTVKRNKKNNNKDSQKDITKDNNNQGNNNDQSNSNELTGIPHIIVSLPFSLRAHETTKVRPDLPEEELKVDMMVLARRKAMTWHKGKIMELFENENEQSKYKVQMEEKGRLLVSRYHLAFEFVPKPEQLYVGARVVVPSLDNASCFVPGVLAELPCRKNRSRFLVFLDDHTPMYLCLPSLRLVCGQLPDVTEDIPDGNHRDFMKCYMKNWPYTHCICYAVGQSLSVELNGVQQSCEVTKLDCSLMQVLFQAHQRKEWIHRGSFRLFLMAKFYKFTLKENTDDPE